MQACPGSLLCLGPYDPPITSSREVVLRVLVGEDPPFTYQTAGADGNLTTVGYAIDVLAVIARKAGFRYRLVQMEGTQFGRQLENGTWTGMVELLRRGDADVALSWFKITPTRLTAMEFADSVPIRTYWSAPFVHQTANLRTEGVLGALTKPLGLDVWMSLLATLLVVALVLWLVLRAARAEPADSRRDYSPGACLLAVYGGFMMQGYVRTPESAAGRIVVISHWAMCIIVYATYTAQLASFLTATEKTLLLSSVHQVATHTQYPLIIDTSSASVEGFRVSSDPAYRALYRRVATDDNIVEMSTVTRRGGAAVPDAAVLYLDYDRLVYLLRDRSCDYRAVVEVAYKNRPAYIGLRRRLPQRAAINAALRRLSESGLLQRLWKRHFVSSVVCAQPQAAPSLGAAQLRAILLVVPVGVAAAVAWAGVECVWHRRPAALRVAVADDDADAWLRHIDAGAKPVSVEGARRAAWGEAFGEID